MRNQLNVLSKNIMIGTFASESKKFETVITRVSSCFIFCLKVTSNQYSILKTCTHSDKIKLCVNRCIYNPIVR